MSKPDWDALIRSWNQMILDGNGKVIPGTVFHDAVRNGRSETVRADAAEARADAAEQDEAMATGFVDEMKERIASLLGQDLPKDEER